MSPFRDPPPQSFDSVGNFRDLGGHRAHDGRRLRRGMLFRSAHLGNATDADVERLAELGLRRVFDFRTTADIEAEGHDRLPEGTQHVRMPMPDPAKGEDIRALISSNPERLEAIFGGGRAAEMMRRGAAHIVSHRIEPYAQFATALCEADAFPALFHCSAGKDRAGWAASVVLLALEVPHEEVVEQYLLSNRAAHRLRGNLREGGEVLAPLFGVHTDYIEASFHAVREGWGDFDRYLREGLGVTDEQRTRLQSRLLE